MDNDNPYSSPAIPADLLGCNNVAGSWRSWSSFLAILLVAILPAVVGWDRAAKVLLVPELPMGDLYFNIVFTLLVFVLTMLSVPLGFVGLRSNWKFLACCAILLGVAESAIIFYTKFYPVL